MADEGTYISNKTQLPLVLRYYNKEEKTVREDFVGFVDICDTSGVSIATAIKYTIESLGLDMSLCRSEPILVYNTILQDHKCDTYFQIVMKGKIHDFFVKIHLYS